jgi:acetyl-CoA decarbonylase/synthase complex subunit gamma
MRAIDAIQIPVPYVDAFWTWRDYLGAMAMRWGVGRERYQMEPGLYAVGQPNNASPLLATANYKLSFDLLRRALHGLDVWVMVVDTGGINVWCAAGKGSFGTEEVIKRLVAVDAKRVVNHSTLILPQLAALGVAAHEVQRQSGFKVVYGPVRALDLPVFLRDGCRVTGAMRQVTFTLRERLAVVPVEVVQRFIQALWIMLGFFLVAGVGSQGWRLALDQWTGIAGIVWFAFLNGIVLTPVLLPFLPGRSFAIKGAETGLLTGGLLWLFRRYSFEEGTAVSLLIVAACSFLGLMFTGSTPYTSASGVRREIRWAIPLQVAASVAGIVLWLVARWR